MPRDMFSPGLWLREEISQQCRKDPKAGFSFCCITHEYVKALKNVTDFGLGPQHSIASHEMKCEHVHLRQECTCWRLWDNGIYKGKVKSLVFCWWWVCFHFTPKRIPSASDLQALATMAAWFKAVWKHLNSLCMGFCKTACLGAQRIRSPFRRPGSTESPFCQSEHSAKRSSEDRACVPFFYAVPSSLRQWLQGLSTTPKPLKQFGLVTEGGCGTLRLGGGVRERAGMLRGPKGCVWPGEDSMAGPWVLLHTDEALYSPSGKGFGPVFWERSESFPLALHESRSGSEVYIKGTVVHVHVGFCPPGLVLL